MSFILVLSLAGCGNKTNSSTSKDNNVNTTKESSEDNKTNADVNKSEQTSNSTNADSKVLIVYFSMPETANPGNMTKEEDNSTVVINGEVLGNTQYAAYVIQQNTEANIFRIEPKTPYTTDHNMLVDQAKKEQNQDYRPEIKEQVDNMDQYDTIFLGYPNWWADMPMIVYSFLEEYDLSGKTIIPFNTHGGSGFSNTISTIEDLQPNASVDKDGFTVSRDDVQEAEPEIIAWLNKLGFSSSIQKLEPDATLGYSYE